MKSKRLPYKRKWEKVLIAEYGEQTVAHLLIRTQARYNELLLQARQYKNKALRHHFEDNILPAVAVYSILIMDGMDKESAGRVLDSLLEVGIESEKRIYRFWGRFPIFFDLIRIFIKPMMNSQYPDGWEVEWIKPTRDLVGLNCRSCFYLDRLTEYGLPDLTQHFCRLDDLLAAEAASSVRFERTQTIARGGSMCDFRYERVKRAG